MVDKIIGQVVRFRRKTGRLVSIAAWGRGVQKFVTVYRIAADNLDPRVACPWVNEVIS